jgi:hypothetical protein
MTFASLRQVRLACIVSLFLIATATGVHAAFADGPHPGAPLFSVAFTLVVVFAVAADSKLVGRQMPSIGHFFMLFVWPVMVPGYLVWTRRWKGLALAVGFASALWLVYYFTAVFCYAVRVFSA